MPALRTRCAIKEAVTSVVVRRLMRMASKVGENAISKFVADAMKKTVLEWESIAQIDIMLTFAILFERMAHEQKAYVAVFWQWVIYASLLLSIQLVCDDSRVIIAHWIEKLSNEKLPRLLNLVTYEMMSQINIHVTRNDLVTMFLQLNDVKVWQPATGLCDPWVMEFFNACSFTSGVAGCGKPPAIIGGEALPSVVKKHTFIPPAGINYTIVRNKVIKTDCKWKNVKQRVRNFRAVNWFAGCFSNQSCVRNRAHDVDFMLQSSESDVVSLMSMENSSQQDEIHSRNSREALLSSCPSLSEKSFEEHLFSNGSLMDSRNSSKSSLQLALN